MTAGILKTTRARALPANLAEAPPHFWFALAFAALTLAALAKGYSGLSQSLGDADDAARLLQVREFITGAPWFDPSTMRMGGAAGLSSHWSRLIDLPIAALLIPLQWIFSEPTAEWLVRAAWPLIALAPLVWVMIATSHDEGGSQAAATATLLTLLCPLGLYQFAVGRIDHHNVMIAATVSAALLIFRRSNDARAWRIAGGLCGLALAIGYEALAPVAIIFAATTVWGFADTQTGPRARDFSFAFAAVFAAIFAATIAPSRWLDIHCDSISLNMVLLAAAGCGGLALALGRGAAWPLSRRLALVAGAGVAGAAAYGALEPKCFAGPMGQLPPELKTVWLNVVAESRSIVRDLLNGHMEQSLGLLASFGIGVAAAARARAARRPADAFMLAVVVGFVLLACWQYKYVAYASFACVVPIALGVARLEGFGELSAATVRLATTVFVSQAVWLAASEHANALIGARSPVSATMRDDALACSSTGSISDLTSLPAGLIAAHIDIGAFISALTDHRVLSAPYHRIPKAILTNHRILESRDDALALALLKQQRVDYIVLCDGLDMPYSNDAERRSGLRSRLINGEAPAYLRPVPLANPASMFHVWQVAR